MGILISIILALIFSYLWREINLKYDVKRFKGDFDFSEFKTLEITHEDFKKVKRKIIWIESIFSISMIFFGLELGWTISEKLRLDENLSFLGQLGLLGGIGLIVLLTKYFKMEGENSRISK